MLLNFSLALNHLSKSSSLHTHKRAHAHTPNLSLQIKRIQSFIIEQNWIFKGEIDCLTGEKTRDFVSRYNLPPHLPRASFRISEIQGVQEKNVFF